MLLTFRPESSVPMEKLGAMKMNKLSKKKFRSDVGKMARCPFKKND